MKQFYRWPRSEPKHHGRQAPRNATVRLAGEIGDPVRTLQQNHGNQAVQRLIHDGKVSPGLMEYLRSTTGNHARQRAISEMNQGPAAISNGRSAEPVVVQRLPTLQSFKDQTKLGIFDGRNNVVKIDRALAAYHKVPITQYQERLQCLKQIAAECQTYLQQPDKVAKRKDGVTRLRDRVDAEIPIFTALKQSRDAVTRIDQFHRAAEAQNKAAEAEARGYEVGEVLSQTGDRLNEVIQDIKRHEPQTLQTLIAEDLNELQKLAAAQDTPPLTRQILAEVLTNRQKITLEEGSPGARVSGGPGPGGSYTVTHALSQGLGQTERLGSLAHELTHVSAGESYQNTTAFLLYDPALPINQIVNLARQRIAKVDQLVELCQQDQTFSAEQRKLLLGKIAYTKENKLNLYSARFSDAADAILKQYKGDQNREAQVMAKDPNDAERIKYEKGKRYRGLAQQLSALSNAIPQGNSVLIEYDSVVNQMLLYMHLWKIPPDNRFYAKLTEVAQEAFAARQQARQRNTP